MDPFLPLQLLLWAAAGAAVCGEIVGWRAHRAQRRSRWRPRLRWVAVLFLVAAVLWFGIVVLDFLTFVRSPEP